MFFHRLVLLVLGGKASKNSFSFSFRKENENVVFFLSFFFSLFILVFFFLSFSFLFPLYPNKEKLFSFSFSFHLFTKPKWLIPQLLIIIIIFNCRWPAYDKTRSKMAFFDPSRPQDFLFISGTKVYLFM